MNNVAYVALYNANAVAVVDLSAGASNPVKGMIPVGYAPSSVVLDSADNTLLVANDKGIGTTNTDLTDNCATYYGVCGFNSHQDTMVIAGVTSALAGAVLRRVRLPWCRSPARRTPTATRRSASSSRGSSAGT